MDAALNDHARRVDELRERMLATPQSAPLALAKDSSNLFRDRTSATRQRLDLRMFDHVVAVDPDAGWVDAEGLAAYEQIVEATLAWGAMPSVVPQLRTITIGGAAAGVGIEATSFRQGLVHDGLLEIEVLLPDGEVVRAAPGNEHAELFHAFPNSYGTLGYALSLRQRCLPVEPYVRVEHLRHGSPAGFFAALERACEGNADFVDGVAFAPDLLVLNIGRFTHEAPDTSDYGYERIYYRSLLERELDHLHTLDYLWRWDTDWFWCSRNFGAEHALTRRLLGRRRLNSRTWTRLMRLNSRLGVTRAVDSLRHRRRESVIQDAVIPIAHASAFLGFLDREVGIRPVWICPVRSPSMHLPQEQRLPRFPLFPLEPGRLYVNFGFWDRVDLAPSQDPSHHNRAIEHEVLRLHGIKSLYSDSFFTREEFDRAYAADHYGRLKARYDPHGRLPGLYEKCVLKG